MAGLEPVPPVLTARVGKPDSRKRISIKFFIVAMIFILFDVDTAFFYPWAVILRDGGAAPFWAMMPFLALLVLGDIYLWKKGAFDW